MLNYWHKGDGYTEDSNGNKYLKLGFSDKNKDTSKRYTELWDKIKDLQRSVTNILGGYDKKYIKININSDDNLPINETLKLHNLIIFVRSVFQKDKKYCTQVFLVEWINLSEGTEANKANALKECNICHYWYF